MHDERGMGNLLRAGIHSLKYDFTYIPDRACYRECCKSNLSIQAIFHILVENSPEACEKVEGYERTYIRSDCTVSQPAITPICVTCSIRYQRQDRYTFHGYNQLNDDLYTLIDEGEYHIHQKTHQFCTHLIQMVSHGFFSALCISSQDSLCKDLVFLR